MGSPKKAETVQLDGHSMTVNGLLAISLVLVGIHAVLLKSSGWPEQTAVQQVSVCWFITRFA
ncbi:MAG: hypothetical protein N2B57_08440 [Planctomycetales bacterium]